MPDDPLMEVCKSDVKSDSFPIIPNALMNDLNNLPWSVLFKMVVFFKSRFFILSHLAILLHFHCVTNLIDPSDSYKGCGLLHYDRVTKFICDLIPI